MGRLPFDPDRLKPRGQARTRDPDEPISVAALASLVEHAVADAFPGRLTVRGEISGTRHRTHWYFNLKDEHAVIGAVLFASAAKKSPAEPRDGRVCIASGRLEYYKPQGRLTFVVDALREDGQGSLDARFRALCEEFRALGWFDPDRKRTPPAFPRRIAVLTSASSAALQDVLDTTRRRCPAVELILVDSPVQGERAADTLARTIRKVGSNAHALGIDAVLLTRGGGSPEDLWCFNDRELALAIVRCPVPVVAAIGHESDTTIAELVADRRAATPTQAAMLLTPDRDALRHQTEALARRAARAVAARVASERRHLRALAARPVLADPAQIAGLHRARLRELDRRRKAAQHAFLHRRLRDLARAEIALARHRPAAEQARRAERVAQLGLRLRRAARAALRDRARRLASLAELCEALGPASVLERGYSITTGPDGAVLRSAAGLAPGARLTTRFAEGSAQSEVVGPPGDAPRLARRRTRRQPDEPIPQLDLFRPPV
jgi:exodeoxyribonuclease VII large subunit